jgi:hypothetical protein
MLLAIELNFARACHKGLPPRACAEKAIVRSGAGCVNKEAQFSVFNSQFSIPNRPPHAIVGIAATHAVETQAGVDGNSKLKIEN